MLEWLILDGSEDLPNVICSELIDVEIGSEIE